MRGFKTGCNLVAPQELWLRPDNLPNLSMISDSIVYYCASGMTEKTCSGLVSARPFAGVAFVWNKEYSKCIKVFGSNAILAGVCYYCYTSYQFSYYNKLLLKNLAV